MDQMSDFHEQFVDELRGRASRVSKKVWRVRVTTGSLSTTPSSSSSPEKGQLGSIFELPLLRRTQSLVPLQAVFRHRILSRPLLQLSFYAVDEPP